MVTDTKELTEWRCSAGHLWSASFNLIQRTTECWRCSDTFPRTPDDYLTLAAERGFEWVGTFPDNATKKTEWKCKKCEHVWPAAYTTIKSGRGCPNCVDMVNGAKVSKKQRELCEMVGGELNAARVGRYTIDIVKRVNGLDIGIEYDSWFWHGADAEYDAKRDRLLREAGWRILRVRTNDLLPTKEQIDDAIGRLIQGDLWLDIELDDWGEGPTFRDVHGLDAACE